MIICQTVLDKYLEILVGVSGIVGDNMNIAHASVSWGLYLF